MDNQAEMQQDNVTDDAPLLNPEAQAEPTTQVEAPIPLRAETDPENTPVKAEADEPIERPTDFPEQFWDDDGPDVEKLYKSYNELRKKFSQGKHKAPENGYDISQFKDAGLTDEDPVFSKYMAWAKENGVSQAAFEDLAAQILEVSGGVQEQEEYSRQAEMAKLGERASEKIEMANRLLIKAPLSASEREAIANSLVTAEAINGFLKYHRAITNEGIPIQPAPATPQMTQEDLQAYIADPRWQNDPAWRTKIERQWMEQGA